MKFVFACGGTGGHVYPALAIAQEFALQNHSCVIVGRVEGMEKKLVGTSFPYFGIPAYPLKRGKMVENLSLPLRLLKSLNAAIKVLKSQKPDAVIGTGGYVSLPTLVAARLLSIPVYLQEQNMYAGVANRIAGAWAKRIFIVGPQAQNAFPSTKTMISGNPTRQIPESLETPTPFSPDTFNILILGGSQGARGVSQKVVAALETWKANPQIRILWQTGPQTHAEFAPHAIPGKIEVQAFLDPIYPAMAHANVIISRAGASTISEILAFGKPAIFVPFPFAAEDHQTKNAEALVQVGAALMESEKDSPNLQGKVQLLMEQSEAYIQMSHNAKEQFVSGAAQKIVQTILADLEKTP
jgi:UDP-N-acetylglucosamine--N-acetylmuramyl-(pentapeptide) pyrophosphoryl-undecaprenol N-acetylglucosamine transferase